VRAWRLGVALAVIVAAFLAAAGSAWADPVPLCNGQICGADWYTGPVTVRWDLNGGSNGGGCATQYYAQDTNQSGMQPPLPDYTYCTELLPSGSATRTYFIRVETSTPTATATLSRPPDSDGWYNHPVGATFQGSAFSGIAWCTPPTTYAGPNAGGAVVSGTCADNAGKTTTASIALDYDASAPALWVTADPGAQNVALSWGAGDIAPLAWVTISRKTAGRHAKPHVIYNGNSSEFNATHLREGIRYAFTIVARDQAGNMTVRRIAATPHRRLLWPVLGAKLSTPPLLSWTPVPGAGYYNLQLYHRGKILSVWPSRASFQLKPTWRFGGRRFRLKPGRYRWYVWPGFGPRARGRYGRIIGEGMFVVR